MKFDTTTAQVGDRVIFDGVEMVITRIDDGGYVGKGQRLGYKAGPLCWARHERTGLGACFDASSHENHTIEVAGVTA